MILKCKNVKIAMMNSSKLLVAIDYNSWHLYGIKNYIPIDISEDINKHILLSGMSGSGKSFCLKIIIAKLLKCDMETRVYFADYKQDKAFKCFRMCHNYYPYLDTVEAIRKVYEILHDRQKGIEDSLNSVLLVVDEYMAFVTSLPKKQADEIMKMMSEILMLGRSLNVSAIVTGQRPDAEAFPKGSRINFGVVIILGSSIKSIYDMVIPKELSDSIEELFDVGEGVMLIQQKELYTIKIPMTKDMERLEQICIEALNK